MRNSHETRGMPIATRLPRVNGARGRRLNLRGPVVTVAWAALFVARAVDVQAAGDGLRFDSPGVLDLAERNRLALASPALAVATLDAPDQAIIVAAPSVGEDPLPLAFSMDLFHCTEDDLACAHAHEQPALAASAGAVVRKAGVLAITPKRGAAIRFVDWNKPVRAQAEGDSASHIYLGRLPGNGYHRVEVRFGHDAPGSFLINPLDGKTAFVHNGADIVAPAPTGTYLVTFNALNTPVSIRVAALDAQGPRVVLACALDAREAQVQFKGWRAGTAFDLLIDLGSAAASPIALRASQQDGVWHLAASAPERLAAIGFACHAM